MDHKPIKIISMYIILIGLVVVAMIGCTPQLATISTEVPSPEIENPTDTPIVVHTLSFNGTSTLPATLTPLPALTTEQAKAKIRELFETNGGCQLPCWWGVTPGTSENNVFYNFIQSIAIPDRYQRSSNGSSDDIEFYSKLPNDMQYLGESNLHGRIRADNGKITQIFLAGFDWPSYHLSPFLFENGKPDDVWVATYGLSDQSSLVPFIVYLLYSEKGMMVSYGGDGKQQGDNIVGCVSVSPYLLIWVPEKKLSFSEAYELTGGNFSQDEFKSISDATEGKMDAKQFYEQYKGVEGVPCMETRADLWPIAR